MVIYIHVFPHIIQDVTSLIIPINTNRDSCTKSEPLLYLFIMSAG